MLITICLFQNIEVQTNWVSGPGTLGPVQHWGSAFYQSDSIAYNITGQISLISTVTGLDEWIKHSIEIYPGIDGHNGIFPADFDGDGDLDLAGAIEGLSVVRIYRNQLVETGSVDFTYQTDLTGISIYSDCLLWCGDLDGDSDPDIVLPNYPFGWFENKGEFNFIFHQISSQTYSSPCCDVGDIDNDGDLDIVVGDSPLDLYRNDGSMNFTREPIAEGVWWRVKLGDLNNDGYLDLLNGDRVHLNKTGSFTSIPDWTSGLNGVDGHWIRDFNNDGKRDLLISDQWDTETIYWYENDGTGRNYIEHIICSSPYGYYYGDGCIAEDIDLDGLTDVVGSYSKVGFFRQITPDSFQEIVVDNHFYGSHWVYAANLDYQPGGSDFDLDILATKPGEFAWWENRMTTQFASHGYLESSILEVEEVLEWNYLYWEGSRPEGTVLNFYVRTGEDPESILSEPWQGPFEVPTGQSSGSFDISSVTTGGERYFQYRIEMEGGEESPVIYEVSVEYSVETAQHDVGVLEILSPLDTIYMGNVTPVCVVKNFGDYEETFSVLFLIGCDYFDWRTICLGAGEVDTVEFDSWNASVGYYDEKAETYLEFDEDSTNDSVVEWITVISPSFVGNSIKLGLPGKFELLNPTPNPGRNVNINFAVPHESLVELTLFDVNGRRVKLLYSGIKNPGYHHINLNGREFPSGIYFVKMSAENFNFIKKILLIR
jgi:hypothetical protein